MKINFPYYVETRKLPRSKVLYPLFEAISNSIDAIEEHTTDIDGKIIVTLIRENQMLLEDNEENRESLSIVNMIIEDNGVGFTDKNFRAFSELSTVWKKDKGGKGLGRVSWLKVFEYAEIESTFWDGDNLKYIRFNFVRKEEAIENLEKGAQLTGDLNTTIRLINCKKEYVEEIPKRRITIVEEIITHFLPFFMVTGVPEIILRETDFEDISLISFFENYISAGGKRVELNINNQKFDVMHAKTKYHSQRSSDHRVYYVANGRVVDNEVVSVEKIPNIPPRLDINDEDHVYVGYVESEYLDKNVNQARESFRL